MEVSGVLTVIKPLGEPVGPNSARYAWGKIRIDDGREIDLMFVNRTFVELANQPVVIKDISDAQDKLRWEQEKARYRVMGTGISIICNGTEHCDTAAAAPAAGGPPPGASGVAAPPPGAAPAAVQAVVAAGAAPGATGGTTPRPNRAGSMEDLVDFGLNAVNYARHRGETDSNVLGSIFGSAMHGFKEGREMGGPETWAAREVFDATSDPFEPPAKFENPPGFENAPAVVPMSQQKDIPF